jgi:hypothetical protein
MRPPPPEMGCNFSLRSSGALAAPASQALEGTGKDGVGPPGASMMGGVGLPRAGVLEGSNSIAAGHGVKPDELEPYLDVAAWETPGRGREGISTTESSPAA